MSVELDRYDNPRPPSPRLGVVRRHRGCTCGTPCKPYRCMAPHHLGPRATPWCRGATEDEVDPNGDWCDDCWYVAFKLENG